MRERLLEMIEAEARGATLLGDALRRGVPFSSRQVSKICCFLRHLDPSIRSAAMGILRSDYLEEGQIRAYATELMQDPEEDIRDKARDVTGESARASFSGSRR